jgi:cytoskeleton protein RodZ
MTSIPNEPGNRVVKESLGARLAHARADLHLSHEEVASTLHLSSRQIEALERDDYASLPGPTYVRGYLKSYALLLGLAPGPILEAHARLTSKPAAPDFSAIAPQKEITSRHHQVRFTTYLVGAIVIGLAVAWWQGRDTRAPNPLLTAPSEGQTSTPPPQAVETQTATPVVAADAGNKSDVAPATKPPAANTPVSAKPASTGAPGVDTNPPAAGVPVAAPTAVPAQVNTAAQLSAGPRAKLVLRADQDSWADIRDARQVKLLYETVPAGRVVTLEGVAPISVFLGNAAGVRLDYNGEAVDVVQYKRGMMARFTLGEDAGAPSSTP